MQDCYSVTTYSVQSILGLIDSGDIAIPEIQRASVWDATKSEIWWTLFVTDISLGI